MSVIASAEPMGYLLAHDQWEMVAGVIVCLAFALGWLVAVSK